METGEDETSCVTHLSVCFMKLKQRRIHSEAISTHPDNKLWGSVMMITNRYSCVYMHRYWCNPITISEKVVKSYAKDFVQVKQVHCFYRTALHIIGWWQSLNYTLINNRWCFCSLSMTTPPSISSSLLLIISRSATLEISGNNGRGEGLQHGCFYLLLDLEPVVSLSEDVVKPGQTLKHPVASHTGTHLHSPLWWRFTLVWEPGPCGWFIGPVR